MGRFTLGRFLLGRLGDGCVGGLLAYSMIFASSIQGLLWSTWDFRSVCLEGVCRDVLVCGTYMGMGNGVWEADTAHC